MLPNKFEILKSDMSKMTKQQLFSKLAIPVKVSALENIEEYSVNFKVIGEKDTKSEDVKDKLISLVNEYILRDKIENDALKEINEDQFETLIKSTPDIEIKRVSDNKVSLIGYKDDVLAAREQIKDMIISCNGNINNKMKNLMKMSSISNNVQWEYHEKNEWKQFNLYMNSVIEDAYSSHEVEVKLRNEDNDEVEIYFNANEYYNVQCLKSYLIRRIIKDSDIRLPANWTVISSSREYELVLLNKYSTEYNTVYEAFSSKLGITLKICEIERVQNARLYKQYAIHKEAFKNRNGHDNEMLLFHGTKIDRIDSICKYGFNRSYCGENGVAYGQGVYFAVQSSYSNRYANYPFNSVKKMFYCQVLVGQYTTGNSKMKVPPLKSNGEQYDSTSDSSGTIFVVYHDNQCYPQYLITYTH